MEDLVLENKSLKALCTAQEEEIMFLRRALFSGNSHTLVMRPSLDVSSDIAILQNRVFALQRLNEALSARVEQDREMLRMQKADSLRSSAVTSRSGWGDGVSYLGTDARKRPMDARLPNGDRSMLAPYFLMKSK